MSPIPLNKHEINKRFQVEKSTGCIWARQSFNRTVPGRFVKYSGTSGNGKTPLIFSRGLFSAYLRVQMPELLKNTGIHNVDLDLRAEPHFPVILRPIHCLPLFIVIGNELSANAEDV